MRIVIDMQGAQTESRFRGIGRYTMNFAQAVVRNRGEHEIILALSGLFPDTIEPIRAAFDNLLPQESIRVWYTPGPVREDESGNEWRRETGELIREAFLSSLQPDVIHISSLFEGYVDDAVTSIGRFDTETPVSVTLYDLLPLLNPDNYLKQNPSYEQHYLRKLESLKRASIYLAVSEYSRQEGIRLLGRRDDLFFNTLGAVEPHFQHQRIPETTAVRMKNKYGISRPFVLYTGAFDERKNLPRLIEAYANLPANLRARHQLVFTGGMPKDNNVRLRHLATSAGLKEDELLFTGYVSNEELVQLYNLCALFVFPSWHEGFGFPALEAMACGAPVIGANTSSLPEVIGLDDSLFDPFDVLSISSKMSQALQDVAFRNRLCEYGLQQARRFSWQETAKQAIVAWETLPLRQSEGANYLSQSLKYNSLIDTLAASCNGTNESFLLSLAVSLMRNESEGIERQLLLDVSELCQHDSATGVQRVVRSYLKWLLHSQPARFRVEPVYATRQQGYRYARAFTQRFLGQDTSVVTDDPVRWQSGDIFFGLDMQHYVQLTNADFYRQLKSEGVIVKFLVYDLLPIQLADLFKDSDLKSWHEQWLTMIAGLNGAICISKSTANAYTTWIKDHGIPREPAFRVSWVHMGADIEGSKASKGVPADAKYILKTLRQRPTFLCVSTIEPRKRQEQVLDAIELLWHEGIDMNLVFVGQQGWKMDEFINRMQQHTEQGKRLFWLKGISDEYLEMVYASSTCLIAASINEGFGLPLIEAAQHDIPVIARDIPIFREVAGEYAYYFRGYTAQELAEAIKEWLNLFNVSQHPQPKGMSWLTWQQSTELLKRELVEPNYTRSQLLVDISELVHRDVKQVGSSPF